MLRQKYVLGGLGLAAVGCLIAALFAAPRASVAMPVFAQAYGVQCSACHTQVPLLNSYGRYIQRTGYASLDRQVLSRALPVWIDASTTYDSSVQSGSGSARYEFGNLAVHGVGYLLPDLTYHFQQWVTEGGQSGGLDTFWVTYNHLLHRDGHLFLGKVNNPAPSPYSMDYELDGATASGTLVGEHDWSATYGNRWGARFVYAHRALDAEVAYVYSSADFNGITDWGTRFDNTGSSPVLSAGDKTFQWKLAYARPNSPLEGGFFGSTGTWPIFEGGTDVYSSIAGYLQLDPSRYGRPGLFAVYQTERDGNPGVDSYNGNVLPATTSHGASIEVYEHVFHNAATVGVRHDFSSDGAGTLTNGDAINFAFNIPHFNYAHVFLEANTGGNSALAGVNGSPGPTWKGMFWLTLPIKAVH